MFIGTVLRKLAGWFIIKPEESKERDVLENTSVRPIEENELSETELLEYMLKTKDVSEPEIINPEKEKTLLILNDLKSMDTIINFDFNTMEKEGNNPYGDYKVVKCNGKFANLAAYKYIKEHHVDVAILDVLTGTNLLMDKDKFLEYNGLDIAGEIKKRNTDSKVAILTSVPLALKEGVEGLFSDKLQPLLKTKAVDRYINLLSDSRTEDLKDVIYATAGKQG